VKNQACLLKTIFLAAFCVASSVFLSQTTSAAAHQNYSIIDEPILVGPVLSCSEISLGFENLTRSFQNIISPVNKVNDGSHFIFVEKFQSTFTKVSFRYLFVLQFFQCREENLFLNLRKLLI